MVSIIHAARDLARVRDVSAVLMRHGFGEVVVRLGIGRKSDAPKDSAAATDPSIAVRLRQVLEELGPSFVKLGQIASTRADVLPQNVIVELRKLQDSVSPVSFEEIKARAEQSLGAPLEELFDNFDETPLAAASVAQVHRATLRTAEGPRDVAVKIQRPGISETIQSDLDILHTLAALLERTIPESRTYSPVGLVQQFDRAITSELDFTTEAENAARFAKNFADEPIVRFPKVYREASSKHVITLEFLDGCKIPEAVRRGFSGNRLARIALKLVVQQIFEDGFFHADPHPGNVLILGTPEDPIYALIDLGMVGRLSPRMRDQTIDLMVAALRRDYESLADAMMQLATPTRKIDTVAYRAEVALLAERYLGKALKDIELSAIVRDLVRTATTYGLEVPPDFMLVGKTLMTIEGIGKEIAPELDILEEVRPHVFELLKQRYSPERIGMELLRRAERFSSMTSSVPDQLSDVLEDLRSGRLSIRSHDTGRADAMDQLGRRLFTALVLCALLGCAAYLLVAGERGAALTATVLASCGVIAHVIVEAYARLFRKRQ
jgi:ubiquinone biosynthesis protein